MTADARLVAMACVIASILLGAVGQIFLKQGMTALGPLAPSLRRAGAILVAVFRNARLFAGVALYFLSAVFWLYGLSRVELSYAYPLLALNMILVTLGARWILKERVSALRWAGVGLIAVGIALVAAS